jgi:hypothetical protein
LSKQNRPFGHMPSSRGPTEGVGFEPTEAIYARRGLPKSAFSLYRATLMLLML